MAGRRRSKSNPLGGLLLLGVLLVVWSIANYRVAGAQLVLAVVVLVVVVAVLVALRRRWRERPLVEIDRMSGGEFEDYLGGMFRRLGYGVKQTGRSGDYGCDLVLRDRVGRVAVQAKRYTKVLGLTPIQEAIASKAIYGADRAMVVTNSGFTAAAVRLARANRVELVDRGQLIRLANRATRKGGA